MKPFPKLQIEDELRAPVQDASATPEQTI